MAELPIRASVLRVNASLAVGSCKVTLLKLDRTQQHVETKDREEGRGGAGDK